MEGTIGEIRMFGGNFAPRNWALCHGQLLPITSWSALFSILGTIYGGDGRTTFALPDLRGRSAVGAGNGPGLSSINLGQKSGAETVTLTALNLPSHNHTANIMASDEPGTSASPAGLVMAEAEEDVYGPPSASPVVSQSITTSNAGSNQSFSIRNPYLSVNYVICMSGLFPSRS